MKRISVLIGMIVIMLIATSVTAISSVPKIISYQGRLTDTDGTPVSDGPYGLLFRIYDAMTDGDELWTSNTQYIDVKDGLFSYNLGSNAPLPDSLIQYDSLWLGIKVESNPEMSPRTRLVSVLYAFTGTIDGATGGEVSGKTSFMNRAGFGTTASDSALVYVNSNEDSDGIPIFAVSSADPPALVAVQTGTSDAVDILKQGTPGYALAIAQLEDNTALAVTNAIVMDSATFSVHADGSVCIGGQGPSAKLEIRGTPGVDGIRYPDGTLQTTAGMGLNTYDSGWFGISPGSNYTLTHNLGTELFLVSIWVKNSSTGAVSISGGFASIENNPSDTKFGMTAMNPSPSTVELRTYNLTNVVALPNGTMIQADQARVVLVAL
jgi:hypothetical protein